MSEIIHRRRPSIGPTSRWRRRAALRLGFTMLEFVVAMIVLGIALTGLLPLEIMQSRVVESLELRYTESGHQVNLDKDRNWNSPVMPADIQSFEVVPREDYGAYYLVSSDDSLARKLGTAASLSRTIPALSNRVTIADDVDVTTPDYTEVGTWAAGTASASDVNEGDSRMHIMQASHSDYAVWTFSNVTPGRYYVMATWKESADQAPDALYEIWDGDADASPVQVLANQASAPAGDTYKDRPWKTLKSRYFGSGTIKVRLYANATKSVMADAVRIVPVPQILTLEKSFNTEEVTVRVKIPLTP
jgi:prepilin-type N-terminal cleavage/methylation domain-containing protein